ncbi:MAG: MFS transporter, partial [Candidatus Eremiobacterota bacterium]
MSRFLRRHPAFARVFYADVLAQFGHQMLLIAFPMLILQATGDISLTGLAFSGEILAYGLLSPFAGYWADRMEQKYLMVAGNLARVTLLLVLLWGLTVGAPAWLGLLLSAALG